MYLKMDEIFDIVALVDCMAQRWLKDFLFSPMNSMTIIQFPFMVDTLGSVNR